MRSSSALALGFVVAHTIALAALHWPSWWSGLLALPCWGIAAIGADEPRPTRSHRHADVRAAEATALGQALLYREGWIIERTPVALALLVALSQAVALAHVALSPADEAPLEIARACAWAPPLLLAGGFVVASMVNMWIVIGPILLFWLLGLVAYASSGDVLQTLRIAGGGAVVVVALLCLDLLRGARRGLERARGRAPDAG